VQHFRRKTVENQLR